MKHALAIRVQHRQATMPSSRVSTCALPYLMSALLALACETSSRQDQSTSPAISSHANTTPSHAQASDEPISSTSAPSTATSINSDPPSPQNRLIIPTPPDENEAVQFLPSNPNCPVPKDMPTWSWDTLYRVEGLEQDAVILTMDAGARLPNLEKTLDMLRDKKIRTTMFLYTREFVDSPRGPEIIKRILADGHELGNHTLNHRELTKLGDGAIASEIDSVEKYVHQTTGATTQPFFRAPYLAVNSNVDRVIKKHCYRSIWLSVDTRDDRDDTTAEGIVRAVLEDGGKPRVFKRGTIFLFHGSQLANLKALPKVVDGIHAAGFATLTLSEALRAAKPAKTTR